MPTGEEGEKDNYTLTPDGHIQLQLGKQYWALSGIMVKARSPFQAMNLMYYIKNGKDATAVNPASTMREFFESFLKNSALILLVIAILVSVVAGVSILVSIYNSVAARMKEIAILRALGATKTKILTLICIEAGLIGLFGGFLGLIVGHLVAAGGSAITEELLGQSINWLTIGREEWLYLLAVVVVSVLAGLVPAMKAYRTPVATNLVVS
jgi:putative ABC transport system permease protein